MTEESKDSKAPTKAFRQKCYYYRDILFHCLDKNDNDMSKCENHMKDLENNCSKNWAKYFVKRRDYLQFRNKVETEGFMFTDNPEEPIKE